MRVKTKMVRIAVCLIFLAAGSATAIFTLAGHGQNKANAADSCRYFSETKHNVCGLFLEYWNNHGGLEQQGYPVSDVFAERNAPSPAGDGQVHNVQYFQRARFEEHLDSPSKVQLGLLGTEQYTAKYTNGGSGSGGQNPPSQTYPLTIVSKTTVSQINGVSADSGNVFLVVEVSLKNASGNAIGTNPTGFSVVTPQFPGYFASPLTSQLDSPWTPQILSPGDTQTGKIAFQIPANAQPTILNFHYSDFSASSNF